MPRMTRVKHRVQTCCCTRRRNPSRSWRVCDVVLSNLYIEHIDPDGTAVGIYAWDGNANYGLKGGASHITAKIKDGTLSWGDKTKFEFQMLPDGRLQGTRSSSSNQASITMMRMT
jgi:hypothetical protein